MVVGIIARGAVKRLGLFGQRPEVNSFPIALHFAEADRFRQIVNGGQCRFRSALCDPTNSRFS